MALLWPENLATLVEYDQTGNAGITDQDIGTAAEQEKWCIVAVKSVKGCFKVL
jgi:hypothetical protein